MILAFIDETLPLQFAPGVNLSWDSALAICSRSQPLLNMIIERNFEATLWRIDVVNTIKKLFGIIWDDLYISEVRLKLCLIIQNFRNGRHFELATNFFYQKLYRKLNISYI